MRARFALRRPTPNISERELRLSSRKIWLDWQAQFDELVHAMSANTTLDANAVISRAVALADAMRRCREAEGEEVKTKERLTVALVTALVLPPYCWCYPFFLGWRSTRR